MHNPERSSSVVVVVVVVVYNLLLQLAKMHDSMSQRRKLILLLRQHFHSSLKFKFVSCLWVPGFCCRILCVFLMQVELPGCKGIWTVYHKSSRGHTTDPSKITTEDDEYHAYLIISMESRTMVYCLPPHPPFLLNCMEPHLISIILLLLVLVIFLNITLAI